MGSYTPVPAWTPDLAAEVEQTILAPTLAELTRRGLPYHGVLYAGLVLTSDGPKVLEFNARFGDPEAQVLLPCLTDGFAELLAACAGAREGRPPATTAEGACVTVV